MNSILKAALKQRMKRAEYVLEHPHMIQHDVLTNLVDKHKNTEWGKQYNYSSIRSLESFQKNVPASSYEELFPWIERMMKGEPNVLLSSKVEWFSKSSGTTNAKSKFIPVPTEALHEGHFRGGKDLLAFWYHMKPESQIFHGRGLALGGSHSFNPEFPDIKYGDVSAVIMANLPSWAQYVRTPSRKIALMNEWESKIEKIAEATLKTRVTNISGVPTWTVVLIERMLELTGKQNMLEIWPHFEVFYHGGVSLTPYREIFKRFFPGDQVEYMESYNASEGFFAFQDQRGSQDMILLLDHGVYYEFIPVEDVEKENPTIIPLSEVEINKVYAMVITTNGGLWRYKIGDTVRFTSLAPYRIRVVGRTKHFINVYGEELMIENAEAAIDSACKATGAVVTEYTAGPVYYSEGKPGCHEWIVEFAKVPEDLTRFTEELDKTLKEVNSDYESKRHKDMALIIPLIHVAPEGTFYEWMKGRGKLGAQNKVPRLSNNREFLEDILKRLKA